LWVGDAGVGDQLAALQRLPVVALVAVVIVSISGCASDGTDVDEDAGGSTTSSSAAEADLDAAVANLRELLDSSPQAIAKDLSALGLTPVTGDEVVDVAEALCDSAFDPDVTTSWLQGLIVTNVAMVGPANRLLDHAGTPEVCPRGPSTGEQDFYRTEVYRALASMPPLPPGATRVPDDVEAAVCDLLGPPGAGDADAALDRLLELASRGQLDAGEFLPYVVEVAGDGCDQMLPTALEVLDRYLGS
jgi:hypothetical protein